MRPNLICNPQKSNPRHCFLAMPLHGGSISSDFIGGHCASMLECHNVSVSVRESVRACACV